jgi:hypothetical protein
MAEQRAARPLVHGEREQARSPLPYRAVDFRLMG